MPPFSSPALANSDSGISKFLKTLLHAPAEYFIAYIQNLSDTAIRFLARHESFIISAALMQPAPAFTILYDRVPGKSINQAFMRRLQRGENILAQCALGAHKDNFIPLLNRLDYEVFTTAALMTEEEQTCTLLEELFRCGSIHGYILLNKIYADPVKLKKISANINHLRSIEFKDGGNSSDLWSGITKAIINPVRPPKKKKINKFYTDMQSGDVTFTDFDFTALKFIELRGRTVVWQNAFGNYINAKIQRYTEDAAKLIKEFNMTTYLKKHAAKLKLQSSLPQPLAITQQQNIYMWLFHHLSHLELINLQKMTGNNPSRTIYVYEVDPKQCDYLTYLQNPRLSLAQYQWANRAAINDLFSLFGRGVVFNQLADIFHNLESAVVRSDGGRYHVLINLFWGMFFGSGRVTKWKQGIQYPNVRGSGGLADLADSVPIQKYRFNYHIVDLLAGYQYVLFLIAGSRACELSEQAKQQNHSDAEIEKIWLLAARQIIQNCGQAVSILSLHNETDATTFLNSMIDVNQLARQMQYWMTTAYIQDLIDNKIPENIYGPEVAISIDISKFRKNTFNERIGCSIDGVNPDLGTVNGQEPIKKANELFYWMINSIFDSYHQIRLTLRDLKKILQPATLLVQEEIRKKSFTHLPTKSYHAIQLALCKERLQQRPPLPVTIKEEITKEAASHERKHAAITIFTFWKKRRQLRQNTKEESIEVKLKARL
jgi:hypothetical protein